jgi:uncharacterized protein (DUF983 family)
MFDKFKVDKNPAYVMILVVDVVVMVMVMVMQTSHSQQRHLAQHNITTTP